MRRFGIPILLCSAYICIMLLVFSTDFGKQSPLFFPQQQSATETAHSTLDAEPTAHAGDSVDAKDDQATPLTIPVKDQSNQAEGGDNTSK